MRKGEGIPRRRIPSWMINSEPKANMREAQGIASKRIGGFSGMVPLILVSMGSRSYPYEFNLHNELDNDDNPSKAEIPMEPIELAGKSVLL